MNAVSLSRRATIRWRTPGVFIIYATNIAFIMHTMNAPGVRSRPSSGTAAPAPPHRRPRLVRRPAPAR